MRIQKTDGEVMRPTTQWKLIILIKLDIPVLIISSISFERNLKKVTVTLFVGQIRSLSGDFLVFVHLIWVEAEDWKKMFVS